MRDFKEPLMPIYDLVQAGRNRTSDHWLPGFKKELSVPKAKSKIASALPTELLPA